MIEALMQQGAPAFLRSDNGPEFLQRALQERLPIQGVQALTIEPGSPWQNGKVSGCTVNCAMDVWNAKFFNTRTKARRGFENYCLHFGCPLGV